MCILLEVIGKMKMARLKESKIIKIDSKKNLRWIFWGWRLFLDIKEKYFLKIIKIVFFFKKYIFLSL